MTKEMLKKMMETTGQAIVFENENILEYENTVDGEPITFEFTNGILTEVYCLSKIF